MERPPRFLSTGRRGGQHGRGLRVGTRASDSTAVRITDHRLLITDWAWVAEAWRSARTKGVVFSGALTQWYRSA